MGPTAAPAIAPATSEAVTPELGAAPSAAPPSLPSVRRSRRPRLLAGLALLVLLAAAGTGLWLLTRSPSAHVLSASPLPGSVALTSPGARQVPAGLADPNTPAYQAGTGFTPDATRVLTVTVVQMSLGRYHDAVGTYPATLDALFPTYAPPGPDGKPMAGPPSATDGYTYSTTGSAYTLSTRLASGQSYTVSGP